jgi:hypothetical protein
MKPTIHTPSNASAAATGGNPAASVTPGGATNHTTAVSHTTKRSASLAPLERGHPNRVSPGSGDLGGMGRVYGSPPYRPKRR